MVAAGPPRRHGTAARPGRRLTFRSQVARWSPVEMVEARMPGPRPQALANEDDRRRVTPSAAGSLMRNRRRPLGRRRFRQRLGCDSERPDVGGLGALLALGHLKLDPLVLVQAAVAGSLDSGEVG